MRGKAHARAVAELAQHLGCVEEGGPARDAAVLRAVDGDALAAWPGGGDELLGAREVGGMPAAVGALPAGVGAIGPVAEDPGGKDLAGGRRSCLAAVQADERGPVDREVERLADA